MTARGKRLDRHAHIKERIVGWAKRSAPTTRRTLGDRVGTALPRLCPPYGVSSKSIRPDHLEHGLGPNFKIVATASGADDGARKACLVDAVADHRLVDMD